MITGVSPHQNPRDPKIDIAIANTAIQASIVVSIALRSLVFSRFMVKNKKLNIVLLSSKEYKLQIKNLIPDYLRF